MSQDIRAEKESTDTERRLEQIRERERAALQPRKHVPEVDPEIRELQERVAQLERIVNRMAQDSKTYQCDHCSHGEILAAQGVGCCWFPGDPERGNCMHYVSCDVDMAHLGPFTCVRECRHCGALINGGPTACLYCAEKAGTQDQANHERWRKGARVSVLDKPAEQETEIISMLRGAVEHERDRLAWSLEDMGEKLGIPAAGVRVLMSQSWSLETAARAAAALGIDFSIVVLPSRLTHGQ